MKNNYDETVGGVACVYMMLGRIVEESRRTIQSFNIKLSYVEEDIEGDEDYIKFMESKIKDMRDGLDYINKVNQHYMDYSKELNNLTKKIYKLNKEYRENINNNNNYDDTVQKLVFLSIALDDMVEEYKRTTQSCTDTLQCMEDGIKGDKDYIKNMKRHIDDMKGDLEYIIIVNNYAENHSKELKSLSKEVQTLNNEYKGV